MKKTIAIVALGIALAAPSFATTTYTNDFESETTGQIASGWTLTTPWEAGQGPITAEVAAGPTGGQALKLTWGTDFANYYISTGGIASPELTGFDADNSTVSISYDLYRTANGPHQWTGDPGSFTMWPWIDHPGVVHQGWADGPFDWFPDNAWIHVTTTFDATTNTFTTTTSHTAVGIGIDGQEYYGGTFTGTSESGISGTWTFGGEATKSGLEEGHNWEPIYENSTYIDNFSMTVTPVPEPGSILALGSGLVGLAGFAIRRRK